LRYDERPDIAGMPKFSVMIDDPRFVSLAGLQPKADLTRDEQWRYDIAFLGAQVSVLHADPDHHTSADSLNRMLSEMSASVPDLSDEEITARLDLFIGALGAGHDLFWTVAPKRGALLPQLQSVADVETTLEEHAERGYDTIKVHGVFTHVKWHSATELEVRMVGVKEHSVSDQ